MSPEIRQLFLDMKFDKENIGTANWNPFSDFIKENDNVLIKPNLVMHENKVGSIDCMITNFSLIRPVIDYVVLALNGTGSIIDNNFFAYCLPSVGCVWTSSSDKSGHLLGKVYSIRLYNRLLTEEERYNNMVVDYMRFRIPIMDEFKMNLTNDLGEKITKA